MDNNSMYDLVASQILLVLDDIKNPVEKAAAMKNFMEVLKDRDYEIPTPDDINNDEDDDDIVLKLINAAEAEMYGQEYQDRLKKKLGKETKSKAQKIHEVKIERVKAKEEDNIDEIFRDINKAEVNPPSKQNKETAETKAEEVKAEIATADELTLPSENDTEETVEMRRVALAKKYGNMAIKDAFSNEDVSKYLTFELDAMNTFREQLMSCFDVEAKVNDAGEVTYIQHGEVTADQIDELIHHYIHEADPGAQDYSEVKLDKFLTVFIPYMIRLYKIYSYTSEQIAEIGNEVMDADGDFNCGDINIHNAEALLMILDDKFQAQ